MTQLKLSKEEARSFAIQAGRGHLQSMQNLLLALVEGSIKDNLNVEADAAVKAAAGAYLTEIEREGDFIRTSIFLDVTGLAVGPVIGDIVGPTGALSQLGRVTYAEMGNLVAGSVLCLETPAGAQADFDLYSAAEDTGVENTLITALTETQLTDGGSQLGGDRDVMTSLPADGEYLYLAAGAATGAGTYTAGKFLIELWGAAA